MSQDTLLKAAWSSPGPLCRFRPLRLRDRAVPLAAAMATVAAVAVIAASARVHACLRPSRCKGGSPTRATARSGHLEWQWIDAYRERREQRTRSCELMLLQKQHRQAVASVTASPADAVLVSRQISRRSVVHD